MKMLRASYTVEGKTAGELAEGLKAHIAILTGAGMPIGDTTPAPAKRGRPAKPKDEEVEEPADDQDEEGEELEAGSDDGELDAESEEEVEEEEEAGPDIDQVLAAFQKYIKKPGKTRDDGMAILKKFKVTSVRGLTEKQYPQVLALLAKK